MLDVQGGLEGVLAGVSRGARVASCPAQVTPPLDVLVLSGVPADLARRLETLFPGFWVTQQEGSSLAVLCRKTAFFKPQQARQGLRWGALGGAQAKVPWAIWDARMPELRGDGLQLLPRAWAQRREWFPLPGGVSLFREVVSVPGLLECELSGLLQAYVYAVDMNAANVNISAAEGRRAPTPANRKLTQTERRRYTYVNI